MRTEPPYELQRLSVHTRPPSVSQPDAIVIPDASRAPVDENSGEELEGLSGSESTKVGVWQNFSEDSVCSCD